LLLPRGADADLGSIPPHLLGTRVVPLSEVGAAAGAVIAAVDLSGHDHDDNLDLPTGVVMHFDCPPDLLPEVLTLPVPATIFVAGPVDPDVVRTITSTGRRPGLDLSVSAEQVADFLSVIAHVDTGFIARASTGAQALAGIAATVAALRGDNVRSAFARPDIAALNSLSPEAAAAVRAVLIGIEVTDPVAVAREFAVLS
jgi:hypothetical protein